MSDLDPPAASVAPRDPGRVTFKYIKSNSYRVVHVDGIVGGPGARGSVFVNFFSERMPIPRRQTFTLTENGNIDVEVLEERIALRGIVREVEMGISMDLPTARAFLVWLGNAIASVEQLSVEQNEGRTNATSD